MRERSSSSMPDFPAAASVTASPPGTARRVSPSRFGQERLSPTLRNSPRILSLGPGSGRETRGRQPDGGVGDRAVWSTGRSRTIRQRQLQCRRSSFVLIQRYPLRQDQNENKKPRGKLQQRLAKCVPAFSTARTAHDSESMRSATGKPHPKKTNAEKSGASEDTQETVRPKNRRDWPLRGVQSVTVAAVLCRKKLGLV